MAEHGKHMMPEKHKAMPKGMPPKKTPQHSRVGKKK